MKLLLSIFLCLAGFGLRAAQPIRVVSFSTVATEIAKVIGVDRVAVAELVKPGVDPHTYEPTPGDLKQVSRARLILASGKHLENYTDRLQESASPGATLLKVGDAIPSLELKEGGELIEDPHWWQSVKNIKTATKAIQEALIQQSPSDRVAFEKNGADYLAKLDSLEKWAAAKIAELPRDRRKLVTSHDALQYFARDFGFTIYSVKGVSSTDEPSSRNVAELVQMIRKEKVKAVFFESIENPKVLHQITDETGAKVGGELVVDGLGMDDTATYAGMFRHNVTVIVEALK